MSDAPQDLLGKNGHSGAGSWTVPGPPEQDPLRNWQPSVPEFWPLGEPGGTDSHQRIASTGGSMRCARTRRRSNATSGT